jgi:parallel beta-helix repeat protein
MNSEDLNTIFFRAREGDTITLPAGKYLFNRTLKLSVNKVTILGAGNGSDPATNTILSFKGAAETNGLEARFVKTVTLRKFGVEDAVGDAIMVSDSSDVLMDTVRAEWMTDPVKTSRMAYGLYPVACDNVQIINSKAIGTRDAGVYVGQSKNIRVSGNEVYYNVAGIEIENSRNAIVENNDVHDNTGGILVFALPGTYRFANNDGTIVRNNKIHDNNQPTAANATGFVTAVPPGTGVMVLASQNSEVSGNTITKHKTAGILAISFQATQIAFDPKVYDPYLRGFYAHDNRIDDFGGAPGGAFADPAGLGAVVDGMFASLKGNSLPQRLPAVIWDGIVDPATGSTGSQGQGGQYKGNEQICSKTNVIDTLTVPGMISYENLDLDLLALLQGLSAAPNFPFPARMNCSISMPPVTGLP